MRTIEIISNEINETQAKIEALKNEIFEHQSEIQQIKETNQKLLIQHAGSERKPKSIDSQFQKIQAIQFEIEQLGNAIVSLQEQSEELEREKTLSKIFEGSFTAYRTQRQAFLDQVVKIRTSFDVLSKQGQELGELCNELYQIGSPVNTFGALINEIDFCQESLTAMNFEWQELNDLKVLNSFLEKEKAVDEVRQQIKKYTDFLFAIEFINLQNINQSWSLHNKKRQDMQPGPAARPTGASGHYVDGSGQVFDKPPRYFGKPPAEPRPTQQARP
jgi:chromosome segregation ATPase